VGSGTRAGAVSSVFQVTCRNIMQNNYLQKYYLVWL